MFMLGGVKAQEEMTDGCIMGRYSFLARLQYCCCCVLWNCTVQRRYCACTNQRLFLFYHVQMFVCVLDLGDDFVICIVLGVQNVRESYLSAEHTRTPNHKFRQKCGFCCDVLIACIITVCVPSQLY